MCNSKSPSQGERKDAASNGEAPIATNEEKHLDAQIAVQVDLEEEEEEEEEEEAEKEIKETKNGASNCDKNTDKKRKSRSALAAISACITKALEDKFEAHGRRVAAHPRTTAALCLMFSAICAVGSLYFVTELRPYKLWIPQDSDFIKVLDWQAENFPSSYRQQMAVWEADNVLTARVIQEMYRLHNRVREFTVGPNSTSWEDLCARVPSIPMNSNEKEEEEVDYEDFDYGTLLRRRRSSSNNTPENKDEDLSLVLPREQYCRTLNSLPRMCLETGLLEIWGLDEDRIMNLTDEQVVEDINTVQLSGVFGFKVNFTKYLGSVTYDESGGVISAKAATHIWVSLVNDLDIASGKGVIDQGSGEPVDINGLAWEDAWVKAVLHDSSRPTDIKVHAQAASSFGKISDKNIWGDVKWLIIGISVMVTFVYINLGRRNLVQQRPILAFMGLLSVGQSVAVAYGVCSILGIAYNNVNSILPMLLIGLGVDDMFVIMAAWEAAGRHKTAATDLVERAGQAMRHAGVAITVTSLTDVTAFAVGASTDLPALRSFCAYAAVGIFAVYVLQATFFLAWLVRDERRMQENRNGSLWCIVHRDWKPWACSQREIMADTFRHFCKFLFWTPVRVVILIISGALMASSVWTALQLHQEFNPMWFIPQDSYLYRTFEATKEHFPENGEKGYIYFANVTFPDDLQALKNLVNDLTHSGVISSVDAWFNALDDYMSQIPEINNATIDYSLIQDTLSIFLQSSSGAIYRNDFTVDGKLDCLAPAPPVTSFRIAITHLPTPTPSEQTRALKTVKNLVAGLPVQGYKAAWSQAYSIWETNEVVGAELWRNILLAGIVVGIVTLILLSSFLSAVLVLTCVASTVIGVAGTMWLWNLTIDTVSCIALVLAIGLSVDYAAHIAHAFLAAREANCKKERARIALEGVGPAVLQGGVSTLLSFLILAWSTSHVFITFFKVFTAASILGLYYGLVFLPVVLSFIGPPAYDDFDDTISTSDKEEDKGSRSTEETQEYSNEAYVSDEENGVKNDSPV